ncbi:MAG: NAD-dependent epimerase/dehydratase family protein [Armatimonadota bacterium]|nr:NAD-dependent epimerase/dehydratase family protein [Armatimonadota bacterium]
MLITGAAGFIGGYLADHLVEMGFSVRGLVRSAAAARALEERGIRAMIGDLRYPETLVAAADGCRTVYHCAGWTGAPFTWEAAFEANVVGTRHLAEACLRSEVQRLVHLSSLAVYGPTTAASIDERAPLWPLGPYRGSKIAGEREIEIAAGRGLHTVILRPGRVFGPGDRRVAGRTLRRLWYGVPLVVDAGQGFCHPVYIRNLTDAVVAAGMLDDARGGTFNVADGDVTWRDFFGHYARMAARPLRSAPSWAVRATAAASEAWARLMNRPACMPRDELPCLLRRSHVSTARIRAALGWTPRVPLDLAMRETEAWLRRTALLPTPVR